jgi:hypothetical protein
VNMTSLRQPPGSLVFSSRVRGLMRVFRPAVWLVLQDVALDAEWCDGQLVAATSARLVAEHLHLDPSTAASALRVLRDRGVVELVQTVGPNGRFGLASYTLHLPGGIDVFPPCTECPQTENCDTDDAHSDGELVLRGPCDCVDAPTPHRALSGTVESDTARALGNADAASWRTPDCGVLPPDPAWIGPAASCIVDVPVQPDVAQSRSARRHRPATELGEQTACDLGPGTR